MNEPILHWKTKQFTGLTGSSTVNWDTFDFSSAPFPTVGFTVLRAIIDVDCIAIAVNDLGTTYPTNYSVKVVYTWVRSTLSGTITSTFVRLNNTGGQITWAISNTGGAGALRITAVGQATTNSFNILMAARIVAYGDI